jgi:hypothetical protein
MMLVRFSVTGRGCKATGVRRSTVDQQRLGISPPAQAAFRAVMPSNEKPCAPAD